MDWKAKWLKPANDFGNAAPVFSTDFALSRTVKQARLFITALGVYEAALNGRRIGQFVLAPGWTTYYKRLQYQEYDVTDLLRAENRLTVTVGKAGITVPCPDFPHRTSRRAWPPAPWGCWHSWKSPMRTDSAASSSLMKLVRFRKCGPLL